jgi:hypothetical protein
LVRPAVLRLLLLLVVVVAGMGDSSRASMYEYITQPPLPLGTQPQGRQGGGHKTHAGQWVGPAGTGAPGTTAAVAAGVQSTAEPCCRHCSCTAAAVQCTFLGATGGCLLVPCRALLPSCCRCCSCSCSTVHALRSHWGVVPCAEGAGLAAVQGQLLQQLNPKAL